MFDLHLKSVSGNPTRHLIFDVPDAFTFLSGQYVTFDVAGLSLPLSIASAPWRLPELHFYYRSTANDAAAAAFNTALETTRTFRVSDPAGDVVIEADHSRPMLIVCAGTGLSQAHSLLDGLPRDAPHAFLLWCVADEEGQSDTDLLDLSSVYFEQKVIVDDDRSTKNRGITWLVQHFSEFDKHRPILCGSPGFVYCVCDALATAGLNIAGIASDVFSYAPRP